MNNDDDDDDDNNNNVTAMNPIIIVTDHQEYLHQNPGGMHSCALLRPRVPSALHLDHDRSWFTFTYGSVVKFFGKFSTEFSPHPPDCHLPRYPHYLTLRKFLARVLRLKPLATHGDTNFPWCQCSTWQAHHCGQHWQQPEQLENWARRYNPRVAES